MNQHTHKLYAYGPDILDVTATFNYDTLNLALALCVEPFRRMHALYTHYYVMIQNYTGWMLLYSCNCTEGALLINLTIHMANMYEI